MAIKLNGIDAIDDNKHALNVYTIQFSDGSTQTTAATGGSLGPTAQPQGELGEVLHTLQNPDYAGTSDNYARNIDISGNYALVTAGTSGYASIQRRVYVYNVITGKLLYRLDDPNAYGTYSSWEAFGGSAKISDDYIAVSANQEDGPSGTDSGVVYIFKAATGEFLRVIDNPNAYGTGFQDMFGTPLDISGKYIAVAAYSEDSGIFTSTGKVYVFDITTGMELYRLSSQDEATGRYFGRYVAISEKYVAVYERSETTLSNSGRVLIFDAKSGSYLYTINNPNIDTTSTEDAFGQAIDIDNDILVVGAQYEESVNNSNAGVVYTFRLRQDGYTTLQTILNPDTPYDINDYFGRSVSISGNYVAAAGYWASAGGIGKGYVFNAITGELIQEIKNPSVTAYDGMDVIAISGNYVIAGGYPIDHDGIANAGEAYIYVVRETIDVENIEAINFSDGYTLDSTHRLFEPALVRGELVHTLDNPNAYDTSAYDYFGYSVAISGNYAIVGAYQEDDTSGSSSGKAYIFDVTTGSLLHTLDNPSAYSASGSDFFGYHVAISGNYAIVSAHGEDDASGSTSGKAYIFDVTTGSLLHTLDNPNAYGTSTSDYFAVCVAISGNYCIAGAYLEDEYSAYSSGKAYIFDVTTGSLLHTLDNPNAYNTSASDYFGRFVAISGNYCIVGAYLEDDAGGSDSGKAYIFDVTTGSLLHTLDNPSAYGTSSTDYFGRFVAISGNYAIVGAYLEDDATGVDSGKAYIFDVTTGSLLHTLDNPSAYGTHGYDNFGYSVAISGNYCIVNAYNEDDASGYTSGKAYIFDVTTGSLLYTLDNPNAYSTSTSDYFGSSVAISDNYCIAGAYGEEDAGGYSSGKAYIFSLENQTYFDKLTTIAQSL